MHSKCIIALGILGIFIMVFYHIDEIAKYAQKVDDLFK